MSPNIYDGMLLDYAKGTAFNLFVIRSLRSGDFAIRHRTRTSPRTIFDDANIFKAVFYEALRFFDRLGAPQQIHDIILNGSAVPLPS